MKLTQNTRLKGQRSHRLFEVFIVSAPWLYTYLTNSLHILHKYNPRDHDVPRTISRSKGWRSGSHRLFKVKVTCCSKFLSCLFCGFVSIWQICFISMGWCKKDVTPLLTHWSYIFLALTHRYVVQIQPMRSWCVTHHFHFKGSRCKSHGPIGSFGHIHSVWLICGPQTSHKEVMCHAPFLHQKVTCVVGSFCDVWSMAIWPIHFIWGTNKTHEGTMRHTLQGQNVKVIFCSVPIWLICLI